MTRTIKTNPCVDLIVKGKATRARRAPTPEELVEIWEKIEKARNKMLINFLTGMPIVVGKWNDIDHR